MSSYTFLSPEALVCTLRILESNTASATAASIDNTAHKSLVPPHEVLLDSHYASTLALMFLVLFFLVLWLLFVRGDCSYGM